MLLTDHYNFIALIHLLAAAVGLGGATIADVLFFDFLRDLKISEKEKGVLHVLSQIIWFALGLIILSGLGLYLPQSLLLNSSPKFLAKVAIALVIVINGAFLNLLISPKLVRISFREKHEHQSGELIRLRKLAFALGAISLISWYAAFILGFMRNLDLGFGAIIGLYGGLVLAGIIISQIIERNFQRTF